MCSSALTRMLVFALWAAACSRPTATGALSERTEPDQLAEAAAITRVEQGLIPEVRVEGEPIRWSLADRMREYRTPAVSIAVIDDHRVVWSRAYGVVSTRTREPATAETLFQAASVSKMVTAVAALRAVDAGQLSLDEDINRALRSWRLPDNEFTSKQPVTLEHLLSHTAGTNIPSFLWYTAAEPLPTLQQILDGEPPAKTPPVRVEHTPGETFRYSGAGSMIVQQLIVDLSGRRFDVAMSEHILAPFGLRHSTFEAPLPPERRAHAAAGHDYDATVLPPSVYSESAAAGLWSTPTDLARLLVEIQLALRGRSELLSTELATRMTTPAAPVGGDDTFTGLGTFIERRGDTFYFGHDGLNYGYLTMARATTDGGKGAVVMANGAGAAELIFEIFRSIAVEYDWAGWVKPPLEPVRVPASRLRALAGRYAAGPDRSVQLAMRGDRLEVSEPFRAPRELVPASDTVFVARPDGARFEMGRGSSGRRELVETRAGHAPVVMARIPDDTIEPVRLLEAGHFDESLRRYQAMRSSDPGDPALAESRFDALASHLLDERMDAARAIRVFRMQVALYPDSARANAGLALALLRAGRAGEAEPYRARARALVGPLKTSEIDVYLQFRLRRLELQ